MCNKAPPHPHFIDPPHPTGINEMHLNKNKVKAGHGFFNKVLKSVYFAPQNKKGMSMWYIGNVDTAVVYIFLV